MSDELNDERDTGLNERDDAAVHPFDQTNGMAGGLEGDADAPEQVDKRTGQGEDGAFVAAPPPGGQMVGGVFPGVAREHGQGDADGDADADTDDPTPA